jgi:Family of unknown function (DUF6492)
MLAATMLIVLSTATSTPLRQRPRMSVDDFAIVTKTYSGDILPFRDLCASIDRHMPDVRHHVIIDRNEMHLFDVYKSENRIIHVAEELFPKVINLNIFGRRLNLFPFTPPIRGWIWQQLVKIAFCARACEKILVIIDSDAVFVKPLAACRLSKDGKVRLYRSAAGVLTAQHAAWRRIACKLFGLPAQDFGGADYISQAVTWSPAVVRAMVARITQRTRLPWYIVLAWKFRFSEYILYGLFCEFAEGAHRDDVYLETEELCHCSWHYRLDESDLAQFQADIQPHHVAVLIQSNLDLPEQRRGRILDGFAVL